MRIARYLLLVLPVAAFAQPGQPHIDSAKVNFISNRLTILGTGFDDNPVVTLGSVTLSILSSTASEVDAVFPTAQPASSFSPGTYLLTATFTNKSAAELQERVRVRLLGAGCTTDAHQLTAARIGTVKMRSGTAPN